MQKLMVLLFGFIIFAASCSLPEGEGGRATITGKVFGTGFNAAGIEIGEYYVADKRVFIVYGDDLVQSDDVRTHFDGSFAFEYLRKGTYTVYTYSDCAACVEGVELVSRTVEITEKQQVVELSDLLIEVR